MKYTHCKLHSPALIPKIWQMIGELVLSWWRAKALNFWDSSTSRSKSWKMNWSALCAWRLPTRPRFTSAFMTTSCFNTTFLSFFVGTLMFFFPYRCEEDHLICSTCRGEVSACPVCRLKYPRGAYKRLRGAERQAERLSELRRERERLIRESQK